MGVHFFCLDTKETNLRKKQRCISGATPGALPAGGQKLASLKQPLIVLILLLSAKHF